jgi:hypothetical protein
MYDFKQELKLQERIELKKALIITLVSMVAENRQQEISDLMSSKLKWDIIFDNLDILIKSVFHNENDYLKLLNEKSDYILLIDNDDDDDNNDDDDDDDDEIYNNNNNNNNNENEEEKEKEKEEKEKEENIFLKIINKFKNKSKYTTENEKIEKVYKNIIEEEKELAFQYYTLLRILSEGENEDGGPITRKLIQKSDDLKPISNITGRIEIVRDNKLDLVYYKIPEISTYLTNSTQKSFFEECPRFFFFFFFFIIKYFIEKHHKEK